MVEGVESGIHGLCCRRVASVGCVVGGCCCWLVDVCGVCRGVTVVGCCVIGGVAVLGEGRDLAIGGFSSGWLGIELGGWCWWYISYWSGVGLVGWWAVWKGWLFGVGCARGGYVVGSRFGV